MISQDIKQKIATYTKQVLAYGLKVRPERPDLPRDSFFMEKRGVFVTLNQNKKLRGCIGYTEPLYALKDGLKLACLKAALEDPRFPPLQKEELETIEVEISILGEPQLLSDPLSIQIGVHGLVLVHGRNKSILLPQVALDYGWDKETFLSQLSLKAGLGPLDWKTSKLYAFKADVFS